MNPMPQPFDRYPFDPVRDAAYQARCVETLELALNETPAYRGWRTFDPGVTHNIDERYAALPALTKSDLRTHFPSGFVPPCRDVREGLRKGEIEYVRTSGTTDEQVTNLWNQAWWNASERTSWPLNAHAARLKLGDHREALLTSALSVGIHADDRDLSLEERTHGRFLFLNEKSSPARWTPALGRRMLAELETFRPVVLEANPSYLSRLVSFAEREALDVFQPDLIVLTFEMACAADLRRIRRVFRSPVCSSYGTTEAGYVLMECEHGRFHPNVESCRVDYQPLAAPHGGPHIGRILVTTFGNPWCVLLRFNTGDLVRLDTRGPCPCGRRSGLTLAGIEGRTKNLTLATEGRLVTERQVDAALGSLPSLAAYQLVQTSAADYRIRCAPEMSEPLPTDAVANALRGLYGRDATITIEGQPDIAASPSGKFRRVWSELPIPIDACLDVRYA